MTRSEAYCVSRWALKFAVAVLAMLCIHGCGASAAVKQDVLTAKNFAQCDTEAKAIARAVSPCSAAVEQLIDLMQKPECAEFATRVSGPPANALTRPPGSITIGGVTYVCSAEVPGGS